jgi:hypothetical protein
MIFIGIIVVVALFCIADELEKIRKLLEKK